MVKLVSKDLFEIIPEILVYIVPGLIGLTFFRAVARVKVRDAALPIASLVLSYISALFARPIIRAFGWNTNSINVISAVSIAICLIISILGILLFRKEGFRSFLVNHFSFSPAPTAWDDMFDLQNGTMIRVKYKNTDMAVTGILASMGHVPDDPWIALDRYNFYPSIYDDEHTERAKAGHHLMININDIEYAELWSNVETDTTQGLVEQ